jgi:hypothetical protein
MSSPSNSKKTVRIDTSSDKKVGKELIGAAKEFNA